MFLTTFIFILTTLFLPSPLRGQSNLTLMNNITLPPGTKALIMEGELAGYWSKDRVVLQNNRVRIPDNEQVRSVLAFNSEADNYFLIIAIENGPLSGEVNVHYRFVDSVGAVLAQWRQTQSNDVGLPEIHLVSGYFLYLHPEDQTVEFFSLSGEQISRQKLFPDERWNHERKLIYLPNKEGKPGLLGMASADLTEPYNTRLFQIDPKQKVQLITRVPLTIPYIVDRSAEGRLFIIGTQTAQSPEKQIPTLFVYDVQHQPLLETYRLDVIPYFARWWQGKVLMIFQDYLSLIDPENPLKEKTVSTTVGTFPLYTIVNGNRCYLFTSDKVQYDSQGLRYQGLRCQIIDLATGGFQTQILTSAPYTRAHFFPSNDETILGIQLDQQVHLYELK